jgi:hypothetical protein
MVAAHGTTAVWIAFAVSVALVVVIALIIRHWQALYVAPVLYGLTLVALRKVRLHARVPLLGTVEIEPHREREAELSAGRELREVSARDDP